jgi:hypothetical protein
MGTRDNTTTVVWHSAQLVMEKLKLEVANDDGGEKTRLKLAARIDLM